LKDTLEQYQVLGLEPGASAERVRKAYLDLTQTWDPERYRNHPLFEETKKKRDEIEEAYHAIRFFLPELQDLSLLGAEKKMSEQWRDFKEVEYQGATEKSRGLLGLLAGLVLTIIIAASLYLYNRGLAASPKIGPVAVVEPEQPAN